MYLAVLSFSLGANIAESSIFQVNTGNGALTLVDADAISDPDDLGGPVTSGAAFSLDAPDERLFTFDSNNLEDIFYYSLDSPGVPRSRLLHEIFVGAGTGDLASVVPEPLSISILAVGSLCVAVFGLRRRHGGSTVPR